MAECELFNDFTKRLAILIDATTSVEKADKIILFYGYVATNFVKRFQVTYEDVLNVLEHLSHPSAADWEDCIKNITITVLIPQDILP
ncbi:hypothetical protein AOC03_00060 [Psychrobacter urativorans]|uniref:Uncharacterized protein n=2 Tax=Psychrobacter urativorans TaxID=45610 RepID=A0A0M4T5U5_9GAMM|nr:hypothetical protein AOC03_00060 [Psychrobacter urativorans]